jgi:hydroxymethylbilane synthase
MMALAALNDAAARAQVEAERSFLAAMGGGCTTPLGALAGHVDGDEMTLTVMTVHDGAPVVRTFAGPADDPVALGTLAAEATGRPTRFPASNRVS